MGQQITTAPSANSRGNTMKRRLIKSMLAGACAFTPLAFAPAAAHAQSIQRPANDVVLSIGQSQLVTVPSAMTDIFVANDAIADVEVKSARQLYLFGKGGGETTVYASNAAGQVVWSANVRVGSNIGSVDQMLRLAMPEAKVSVATMGTNTILLTGTVGAPEDAAEAERLVSAFVGENTNVISRLKMATPLQVNLQVRIAEVSRSLVREIGLNVLTQDRTSGFLFGISRGRNFANVSAGDSATFPIVDASTRFGLPQGSGLMLPFDPRTGEFITSGTQYNIKGLSGATTLSAVGKIAGLDVASALDLGERIGLVTTLSQPNLTALSGETADFLAGGEFPIPLSQGLGTTSIEYKKYGVSLAYTPTVLANGRISLRVRPEVSELSSQGAIVLNNFSIPALTVRRAETTVELGSGQSFMIAGLLSNNSQNAIDKTPGVGDMPILGSLFRSTSYRRGETELVIVVTPYLVNPVNANDIALPTDAFKAPKEIERLLGNVENDGVSGGSRPKPKAAPDRTATPPSVGAAEPQAKPRKGKSREAAAPAVPGFNLK